MTIGHGCSISLPSRLRAATLLPVMILLSSYNIAAGKGIQEESIRVTETGDVIEYLQGRAEGEGFIRINGEILATGILVEASHGDIEITTASVTEWRVLAIDDKQNTVGWVLIDEQTVEFVYPWEKAGQ